MKKTSIFGSLCILSYLFQATIFFR